MAFVAAKCTQCGANLQVDETKEAANCEHCGSAFIVEKAINNYNVANAQINAEVVNVQVGTTSQRLKDNAEKSLAAGEVYNAYLDFRKAIELDRTDSAAYWGIVKVHMAQFPWIPIGDDFNVCTYSGKTPEIRENYSYNMLAWSAYLNYWKINESEVPNYIFIDNARKSAISYADENERKAYETAIAIHNKPLIETEEEYRENEELSANSYKVYTQKQRKMGVVIGIVMIIIGIFILGSDTGVVSGTFGTGLLFGGVWCFIATYIEYRK